MDAIQSNQVDGGNELSHSTQCHHSVSVFLKLFLISLVHDLLLNGFPVYGCWFCWVLFCSVFERQDLAQADLELQGSEDLPT